MGEEENLIQDMTNYTRGKLTEEEAIDLWLRLLKYPEWIYYLKVELALNELHRPAPVIHRQQR
ncbi:hypothetical protein LQ318_05935 [Aliifodinibius salicampi]|uniref:Uncharacterized protein n=1 Tax=Fodinibius salicampi TaxID=1920655 RepID=A0ABT3PX88_9BACT|nr:hypothetical protein [Fodinibius salicampi]MCW9712442.1 hypothetical protein [Fodinibius salicampi]